MPALGTLNPVIPPEKKGELWKSWLEATYKVILN